MTAHHATPLRHLAWVDAHRADIVGMAQSLVRIPSENKQPHGSEKACQMFVAESCATSAAGWTSSRRSKSRA